MSHLTITLIKNWLIDSMIEWLIKNCKKKKLYKVDPQKLADFMNNYWNFSIWSIHCTSKLLGKSMKTHNKNT